ncbi:tyrosine-type recombinase/integrase [Lysinibacillus varians]|uniref:site-specific integrase n=1 Tax=Lysinibacillus varians TaxID=1145276 RepID=UPI00042E38AE|nr:tyrosine-type recombinase/integrase [Lysinibacillus varians]AHN22056.1 tyrosine recombinase XerC [Lysinibacillus varians]
MELIKSTKEKEVYSYLNNKGEKLWMFRHKYYDDLTGKRKEKKKSGFKTEKAAIKALFEVKAQTLRGETKHIENDNLTVAQWLDLWFETSKRKWKNSTVTQREIIIRLNIKPLLGFYKLQKLDKATYQREFINVLEKQYEPGTVRQAHSIFSIAVNAAIEEEILHKNKFKGVSLPSSRNKEAGLNILTSDQLSVMLNYAKEYEDETYYSILLLLSYTGMRKGEALGLQWLDIDFEKQAINIIRNRTIHGTGTTKTKNSERKIKVGKNVIDQLIRYQKVIKENLLSYGKKLEDEDYVFLSLESMIPMPLTTLHKGFKRIVKRAGLKECTIHSLRHSHATILMNDGVPVRAIAERLGNTPEMIYTTYGHVLREMEDKIIDTFDRAIEIGAKSGANL